MRRIATQRLAALCLLLTLAACAKPEAQMEMAAEPAGGDSGMVLEETPMMAPMPTKCAPGEGDGIGGTGCAID